MYLLQVSKSGDVFKDDSGVVTVPEFVAVIEAKKLGYNAVKWVALVCDYDSPYRHLPLEERKKMVSKDIYDKYEWAGQNRAEVIAAIDKYILLQRDPLDEQLKTFNDKIDEFTKLLDKTKITADNAESIQKIMIGVDKVLKTRQAVVDAIERRGKREVISGDKKLSLLERNLDSKNKASVSK